MVNDPSIGAGLGIGAIIIGLVIYFGTIILMIWIGYLIMRTAVKNGILRADEERARRGIPPYGGQPGGYGGPPSP